MIFCQSALFASDGAGVGRRRCHAPRMGLHDVLSDKAGVVMETWREAVSGTLAPESLPSLELQNHLPDFLKELTDALREAEGLPRCGEDTSDLGATAAGHGEQRLRLGFSLDSVVREYGSMRDAIMKTAHDAGVHVTMAEMQIVFSCSITAIARAVTEYTQQRDAELQRRANEHFAFIAHELRNPLSSALSAFQLLQQRGVIPEDRVSATLGRGLKQTSELIDKTLHIARVASGIELHREPAMLSKLLADVEDGSTTDAHSRSIHVDVTVENDQELFVDVRLVRSAVGNLLRNAVKYSHDGAQVHLRGSVTNERAVIEIEDGCGGLAPGMVESVFTPFVRMDSNTTGFGLGLAIAKQAADAHGGSIRVQNLPGKGCIFVLEIPVQGETVSALPS